MRLTDTQKAILKNTDAKSKVTAADLSAKLHIPSGPAARSANSLIKQGWLRSKTDKDGNTFYSRTAEGGKVAKKL